MPRVFAVDFKKLEEELKKEKDRLFDSETRKIKGPSDKIWIKISERFGGNISAKPIYTIIKQNRKNILENIDFQSEASVAEISETPASSSNEYLPDELNFNIHLTVDEWKNLEYITYYKRGDRPGKLRIYSTLKPYKWTEFMQTKFHENTTLPCALVFKKCDVRKDPVNDVYVWYKAICSECDSSLVGMVNEKPADVENVVISCTYKGKFSSCSSRKKRRIKGEKQRMYLQKMINEKQTPSLIRRMEVLEHPRVWTDFL